MISRAYGRLKDLERKGAGFIREEKIGTSLSGEIYAGTLHYNNGSHARVMVLFYPKGGGRIIGQADKTKENSEEFEKLISYMESLEKDSTYRETLIRRMVTLRGLSLARLYVIIKMVATAIRINMQITPQSITFFALGALTLFLLSRIRLLTEGI